jgi:ubiquinone/menaquinone biosynthesis C-methylase UbiE
VKTDTPPQALQKKFDFTPPKRRPFLADLSVAIDTYEEGVAHFFQSRTGLDYYAAVDRVVDFVVNLNRSKVADLLTDTGVFTLKLAARKGFTGKIYALDSNLTLLERTRQRAAHSHVQHNIDFRHSPGGCFAIPDSSVEIAVSFFDFHRHRPEQFLAEAVRILVPEGHLVMAEMIESGSLRNRVSLFMKNLQLKYLQKNPTEAEAVYYDQDDLIGLLFAAGFRQVVVQELQSKRSGNAGVFSLIAATK